LRIPGELQPTDISHPAEPQTPPPRKPPLDPRALAARRHALAQLDELYVEDAGLVILWPFLTRFFARVGLLAPESGSGSAREFIDEQAQTQAIALLARLGLDDPEPLEYRLALAKLLCGRAPEQSFELERPLAPAQINECEQLLSAVIDHAPILRAMSIASFRQSFLRRAGALSVESGRWRLHVERLSHDLVLDRFSWSWAWVKLPWMPDPLQVEW
jgi:hypothetical protein